MASLVQDFRYGLRLLAKAPAFTIAAVASLALGLGANTTVFTLVNTVLLHPLPVAEPSRLVAVWTTDERNTGRALSFLQTSPLNYRDLRDANEVFSGLTGHQGLALNLSSGKAEPQQVAGEIVTGNYFDVLGARPLMGRGFLPEEDAAPGARLVTVLGYNLWQTRYGGDPAIVGRTITIDNEAFTVVGVMRPGFKGTSVIGSPALWVPYMTYPKTTTGFMRELIDPANRRGLVFNLTGRLKPGVTVAQADANLKTIAQRLSQAYPDDNRGRSMMALPIAQSTINPGFRSIFVRAGGILMAVVALVLLIACANVANLLLARAAVRQKEIAVRLALGASRGRLVRQLLVEGAILAVVGGLAGLGLAYAAKQALWSLRPPFLDADAVDLRLDARVLFFTTVVTAATGMLFGLAPALQASRPDLVVELKEKASAPGGSNRLFTVRHLLVVVQVALSLVALVGAGLFLRSLRNAEQASPGFDLDRLAVLSIDLGAQGYMEERGTALQRAAIERVGALGGVASASFASTIPLFQPGFLRTVFVEGQDATDRRSGRLVEIGVVGASYFQTMGIRVLRGRGFETTDQMNTPGVVVVNETMAKRFWPNEDAIGKRFKFFGQPAFQQVVGIARDSKYDFIGEDATPFIYQALTQVYQPTVSLFVRAEHPAAVLGTVRHEVQALDRNLPLTNVFTLASIFDQSLWAPRMGAWLLAIFAVLSLVLAVIGIYGVMAYSVSQRSRELGIRMALGASRRDVIGLVVGQGVRLAAIGVAVGLAASLALTQLVETMLYGVGARDLLTFISVPLLLAAAALAASYVPAARATKIDPMVALRYE